METQDFVRALITPEPETDEAEPESPTTPQFARPNDLFFETSIATTMACVSDHLMSVTGCSQDHLLPLSSNNSNVISSPAPPVSVQPRKEVRFDMTPRIKELDNDRITGPPESDEEYMESTLWRSRQDYVFSDLFHEHCESKRASFNAYLHAAFPIEEEEQLLSDEFSDGDHPSVEHATSELTAEEERPIIKVVSKQPALKSAIKPASMKRSPTRLPSFKHPDFEDMAGDCNAGRTFRVTRWNHDYPELDVNSDLEDAYLDSESESDSDDSDDDLVSEDEDEGEEDDEVSEDVVTTLKRAHSMDEVDGDSDSDDEAGHCIKRYRVAL